VPPTSTARFRQRNRVRRLNGPEGLYRRGYQCAPSKCMASQSRSSLYSVA
jgi:hypothetical protein